MNESESITREHKSYAQYKCRAVHKVKEATRLCSIAEAHYVESGFPRAK